MQPPYGSEPPERCITEIELRLTTLGQLFNSLDPSPFHEKEIDREAEDYIVGAADEASLHEPVVLVIRLTGSTVAESAAGIVPDAVHNHFQYRLEGIQRRLGFLFREGRIALLIGLIFLFACISIRELVFVPGSGALSQMMAEGLLILGWVAMWRPLQIFLYDWWPVRHQSRLYEKLAKMPVVVRPL